MGKPQSTISLCQFFRKANCALGSSERPWGIWGTVALESLFLPQLCDHGHMTTRYTNQQRR